MRPATVLLPMDTKIVNWNRITFHGTRKCKVALELVLDLCEGSFTEGPLILEEWWWV